MIIMTMMTTVTSDVESSWNVTAHGDAREGKWRGNWRMEWVASTLHTASEHGVSSITTADTHTSAASSRLNWRPRRFKWTRPFRRKTKSGFCACAITFQTRSTWRWFAVCVLILHSVAVSQVYRYSVVNSGCGFVNGCYSVTELTWSHSTVRVEQGTCVEVCDDGDNDIYLLQLGIHSLAVVGNLV